VNNLDRQPVAGRVNRKTKFSKTKKKKGGKKKSRWEESEIIDPKRGRI
jgi:hypothetical protein